MRYVLISLKPYYYYSIGEGIKKVEVRKSYPKAEDWSRNSWFYMSRDEKNFANILSNALEKAKADTVRKMQERLKAEAITIKDHTGKLGIVVVSTIDQIAKEMLEGKDENND